MLSQNHLYCQEPVHIRCIHGQSQASKLFPLEVLHTHTQTVTGPRFQYRETFTKSAEDDVSSHVLLPQILTWPAHIRSAALSITFFFFPICVERMSRTRRHSNTQGERICVNGVVSDAGYACSFFVCVLLCCFEPTVRSSHGRCYSLNWFIFLIAELINSFRCF